MVRAKVRPRNPLFEKLHPRDARGRFRKRGPGDFGWLQKAADQADPEIGQYKPRPGDLPFDHPTMASLLHATPLYELSGRRRKQVIDQLHSYLATHTAMNDPKSGMRVRLSPGNQAITLRETGAIVVSYQILDANTGKEVGVAVRQWQPHPDGKSARMLHIAAEIDPKWQGSGFMSRWNQKLEKVYKANGVKEIQLEANLDVGGYAWAKQGYDFFDFSDLKNLLKRARLQPHYNSLAIQKLIARSTRQHWDEGTAPTPLEWAMAGWTEGAKDWPGKRMMLGAHWNGVKPL